MTKKEFVKPYYEDEQVTLYHGDCVEVMQAMPDESVDAIVTDPPYGLGFMGKAWDALPPGEEWARECLRVLKPGGHLLAFGGTRTWHRLAVAVEDARFEIRDSIAWLYASGFPKSLDVSKAIDKAVGAERVPKTVRSATSTVPPEAAQYQGWGTALKPAFEPIVVARKPLSGTVAQNVLTHGTGALNIDGCRIGMSEQDEAAINAKHAGMDVDAYERRPGWSLNLSVKPMPLKAASAHELGRWPANVVLDESQAEALDKQSGPSKSRIGKPRSAAPGDGWGMSATGAEYADQGGASRFFYVAKAPKRERPVVDGVAHPTVKPLALMQWLVRLVTPPGGTVLEPFAGSGTTVEAALLEGFNVIGVEMMSEYLPLIEHRIERASVPCEKEKE